MTASQTKRLSGDEFDSNEDLDFARMQRLVVGGRSAIRQKLMMEHEIADNGYSPYVTTTIRVDNEGEILESYLDVGQENQGKKQKFPARRIFLGCVSENTRILMGKLDMSLFNFSPSENHSDWMNASQFGLTFQKANNKQAGEYGSGEWVEQGVSDFALKLVINATAEVGVATARIVALPLPVERLGELSGGNAKDLHSYPAINVFAKPMELMMVPQNSEPARGDGLPVLPMVLYQGPPGEEAFSLDATKLMRAMFAVWSTSSGVKGVTAEVFARELAAPPVGTDPVPAEWAWPSLETGVEDNSDQLGEFKCQTKN